MAGEKEDEGNNVKGGSGKETGEGSGNNESQETVEEHDDGYNDGLGGGTPKAGDALKGNELDRNQGIEDDWIEDDGWKSTTVAIRVPLLGKTVRRAVGTLYHRSIMSIIRAKIANSSDMQHFHYEPYEVLWQPNPSIPGQRIHSEVYQSEAFMKAHREVQESPGPPGCTLPRVVIGLMFWSDATHVSAFNSWEKLWPCYMAFANKSKYCRRKPTLDLCHHIAYLDMVRAILFVPRFDYTNCYSSRTVSRTL